MLNNYKNLRTLLISTILFNSCLLVTAENIKHYNTIIFRVVETKERLIVPGNAIVNIEVKKDQILPGAWSIGINLNNVYKRKFGEYTSRNVGKDLEMICEKTSLIKAMIAEPIIEGKLSITSNDEREKNRILEVLIRK